MAESKHTLGPWEHREPNPHANSEHLVLGHLDQLVAVVLGYEAPEVVCANAQLISAAPTMRDALGCAPIPSKYHGARGFEADRFLADYEAWAIQKRAALAKAEGAPHG